VAESVRTSTPSIAELRAATQPPEIFARNSGEHWAGRLYIRRLSPYATRVFLRAGLSPNAVTWLFVAAGLLAAAVLSLPGLGVAGAVAAFLAIQVQILLDCSDGEVARWQQRFSVKGIYLDRIGHYVTESALPIALGVRADGGWDSIGQWTTLGLVTAVLVLLIKSETALVHVACSEAGRPAPADRADVAAPRGGLLRTLRRGTRLAPFYRAFVAMEFTLLALVAAVVDLEVGGRDATQVLVVALVPVAAITALGHLVAILTSDRLR
jgi:phosphatidylglycerophosphate synthase